MSESFSEEELQIVDEYIRGHKSMREIALLHEGFGRTKISNILDKYANSGEERAIEIALRKASQKNHKEVTSLEDASSEELTEEQVELAYREIIEGGRTLTKVSEKLGKNRETVKRMIVDFLGDDKLAIKEFQKRLKDNQKIEKETDLFEELSEEEKKKSIFERLNLRRKLAGKTVYPERMLERKFDRLISYFEKRNTRVDAPKSQISKQDLLRMMYDYPTLLSMSLTDKIKPAVNALDHKHLGYFDSSRVLKQNPSIIGTSLSRISLQMRILKDSDALRFALNKPRTFRTSPELMYALVKLWNYNEKSGNPFITTKKMQSQYGIEAEQACKLYDIKDEYGDDEYFDGR